eukprot:TRINITY_DN122032_c0_g1_i1.p2 TRINITY_DN122032_c0_g1~~TRINITY_DN122032_c0_g1_i1.p2  ORF type:complete len:137 (-),score=20.06 TRINITY_DN122032_c0_g1_i1:95-505(-)
MSAHGVSVIVGCVTAHKCNVSATAVKQPAAKRSRSRGVVRVGEMELKTTMGKSVPVPGVVKPPNHSGVVPARKTSALRRSCRGGARSGGQKKKGTTSPSATQRSVITATACFARIAPKTSAYIQLVRSRKEAQDSA